MTKNQRWRAKMRSQGRCIRCGQEAGGRILCQRHYEYMALKRREREIADVRGRYVGAKYAEVCTPAALTLVLLHRALRGN